VVPRRHDDGPAGSVSDRDVNRPFHQARPVVRTPVNAQADVYYDWLPRDQAMVEYVVDGIYQQGVRPKLRNVSRVGNIRSTVLMGKV
jgi:hypothetical protein